MNSTALWYTQFVADKEIMKVTEYLEMAVLVGALVFKCSNLLVDAQYFDQLLLMVGYLFVCTLCLAILSRCCENKMRHTRQQVGGSIYAWLIPMANLEQLVHTPVSCSSWSTLYGLVVMDQIQIFAILVMALWSKMSWPPSVLPLLLFLLGTLRIGSATQLGMAEQLTTAASYAIFLWLLCNLFHKFPQTFSFGEGVIICQATSQIFSYLLQWLMSTGSISKVEEPPYDFISAILTTSLTIAAVVYILLPTGCGKSAYYLVSCLGITAALIISSITGHVQRIVADILSSSAMVALIIWWMATVAAALVTVMLYNTRDWKVTTVDRKYFHIMAIMIFLPGIFFAPHLTRLASVVAMLLFLALEFVRFMSLPYLGLKLNSWLTPFLDGRQDSGSLILTHIYLLSGCALPLWLTTSSQLQGQNLSLFAGIISLGVGDSCASLFGSRFGRLAYPDYGTGRLSWMLLLVAVLESCTLQVDNLVLPLYTYVLLSGSHIETAPVNT
ncbi:dolichol kinase-like isoform X2 [Watersipora subatra]|uniref:dolichol kinase-like isoform X2 n=1 Tax=Watersipora subatra TaxID=2589382 RepID=UPI00355BA3FA